VTRYFMTIPEACELVIQAGAIGDGGDVMVLDMGEQVRIVELAERLIAESGRNIEIVYTGLRPGEKIAEHLVGDGEEALASTHPLISRVTLPPLTLDVRDELSGESQRRLDLVPGDAVAEPGTSVARPA